MNFSELTIPSTFDPARAAPVSALVSPAVALSRVVFPDSFAPPNHPSDFFPVVSLRPAALRAARSRRCDGLAVSPNRPFNMSPTQSFWPYPTYGSKIESRGRGYGVRGRVDQSARRKRAERNLQPKQHGVVTALALVVAAHGDARVVEADPRPGDELRMHQDKPAVGIFLRGAGFPATSARRPNCARTACPVP